MTTVRDTATSSPPPATPSAPKSVPVSVIVWFASGSSVPVSKVPFGVTLLSLNTRPAMKPSGLTTRSAVAGAWLLPPFVCRAFAAMKLLCVPFVAPVTLTLIVQPPAGIVAPFA